MGSWKHLILPSITLAAYSGARITQLTRSSIISAADGLHPYGKSEGLKKRTFCGSMPSNASIPIITITSLQIGIVFGGAVITETIFSWPGIGRLLVQSIHFRDYPIVQASIFMIAMMFCLINLITDIGYALVNPEIRLEKSIE
jgi:ABC-type dipeptide/oligopeptide/nickel transport system permease component